MSPALIYGLTFVLVSAAIGGLGWPRSRRHWGLLSGATALAAATWLGWRASLGQGAWHDLLQQRAVIGGDFPGGAWLQAAIDGVLWLLQSLAAAVQYIALNLPLGLGMILVFLAFYLLIKLGLLPLAWLVHGLGRLAARLSGRTAAGAAASGPDGPPVQAAFLRPAANGALVLLALVLALLPYAMRWHPALAGYFNALFWAGAWIMLLEIRQWLYTGSPAAAALDVTGSAVASRPRYPLEKVYGEYIRRHKELLFYCAAQAPRLNSAQEIPAPAQAAGPIAQALRRRLTGYLPDGLLLSLLQPVAHYERGGDLLFTETLSGYHVLLLVELIQHHKNRGEVTLLICAQAATAQVESALERQLELHQLRLTQRWAVLGRDALAASSQVDVLICPDSALESALLHQQPILAATLARLRLLICLDVQDLNLSLMRLSLSRLWLSVPRERVQRVVQAEPYYQMESQVRHLLSFRELAEYRLNPQLTSQRYLLVWDAHSPRREHLLQYYFKGYQGTLELSLGLLLLPWGLDFDVVHLDPEERCNENAYEHLNDDLLRQYGHEDLLDHAWPYKPVGHLYAARQELVCQWEDLHNLPLALERNSNFSGARASLLNVLCGNYLLRDYYRACLYGADGLHNLSHGLRPLATAARGTLPELAATLCQALKQDDGLTRAQIQEHFLSLAPGGLPAQLAIDADWTGLQRLFRLTLAHPPRVEPSRGPAGETRYFIHPEAAAQDPRYYTIIDEQGRSIGALEAADHGLRYARDQYLLIGGRFYHIHRIEAGQVLVRHREDRHSALRRRYVFRRRYTFQDGVRCREGETYRSAFASGLVMTVEHWHRAFQRTSDSYLEFAEAARPLPDQWRRFELDPPVHRSQVLQNVAQISLQQSGLTGEHALDKVAFTLCAVLQDCLVSLFPRNYWRLAVVSPQSRRGEAADDMTRFLHELYPALTATDHSESLSENLPLPPGESGGEGGNEEVRSSRTAPEKVQDAARLDLYILEDADHDLGVVRTLCERAASELLLGLARDYLAWALQQPPESLYQSYGHSTLPDCLDYAGALHVLGKLHLPGWKSPRTGPLDFVCDDAAVGRVQPTGAFCDFCAGTLNGPHHELADGRLRCHRCTGDAVDTVEAFRRVLDEVLPNMERRYRIGLPRDIRVRFATPQEIARHTGRAFVPGAGVDSRAVGLAVRERDGSRALLLENGVPRLSTQATLAHELTHLWQFEHLPNIKALALEIIEGQARYVEIDYLWANGGELLAAQLQRESEAGDSVYARGYRRVAEHCPADAGRVFEYFERLATLGSAAG